MGSFKKFDLRAYLASQVSDPENIEGASVVYNNDDTGSIGFCRKRGGKLLLTTFFRKSKKTYDNCIFGSEIEFKKHLDFFIKKDKEDQALKVADALAKKAFVNPSKVGDVFTCSWGCEQTNIDYYQVIAVSGKRVTVRKIRGERKYQDDNPSSMVGVVTALVDQFVDSAEPFSRIVSPDCSIKINSYSFARLASKNEQGLYANRFSSYA